jgi:hypothetical protein
MPNELRGLQRVMNSLCHRLACLVVSLCALAAIPSHALEVRQTTWNGHDVLLLSGEVAEGDASRLAAALVQTHPSPHGLPVILLDSIRRARSIFYIIKYRPGPNNAPLSALSQMI